MNPRYVLVLFLLVTKMMQAQQMQSLFNGTDIDGWHIDVPEMDTIPEAINPFIVRKGMLVSLGTPQGHIITDAEYANFRLEIEYRFAGEPGNCGGTGFCLHSKGIVQDVS